MTHTLTRRPRICFSRYTTNSNNPIHDGNLREEGDDLHPAPAFRADHRVHLIDLPDHGRPTFGRKAPELLLNDPERRRTLALTRGPQVRREDRPGRREEEGFDLPQFEQPLRRERAAFDRPLPRRLRRQEDRRGAVLDCRLNARARQPLEKHGQADRRTRERHGP